MSEDLSRCNHGTVKAACETCAAWEAAIYSQKRAEKAEAEVERLKAVFHAAEGILSGLEYLLPLEHGSTLHRFLREAVYEYRKFMEKRKEGGA